jgi:tetratricopeptide (TPR) repeat protein
MLHDLQRFEEALACADQAVALVPDSGLAHNNRGAALGEMNRAAEALAAYERAVALSPNLADAATNHAVSLLILGRYEEGWRAHECRKRTWDRPEQQFDPARAWLGGPLEGRRLFIHQEQGLGDTIQFARYLKLFEGQGEQITFQAPYPLEPLLRPLLPDAEIVLNDDRPADYHLHCSLMSLPLAFGTTLETIPTWPCYLSAEPERRADFAARLGPKTRPRVGLAWCGNPNHKNDKNRSIAFDRLAPFLGDDVEWVCIMDRLRISDAEAFAACGKVHAPGDDLDFANTAALIENLDLVISVDTSLAHLAGALGVPTWVLLTFRPDWRWLLDREDSPWYPSVRLLRQPRVGDWDSVLERMRAELPGAFQAGAPPTTGE